MALVICVSVHVHAYSDSRRSYTSFQIILTAAEYTAYSRETFSTFSKLFSPDNGPDDILSINDTINSLREAVKRVGTALAWSTYRNCTEA